MAQGNLIGQTLLGYKVIELLGTGTFGTVYKVEKINESGRYTRALKHITIPSNKQYADVLSSMRGDVSKANNYFAEMLQGILSEIQILNSLTEKSVTHIVRYFENEIVTTDSPRRYDIYILMEYLKPLKSFIAQKNFTVRDVAKLGVEVLTGLKACHDNGIIHRDIKDDNIFVSDDGDYKIGDFGVSKVLRDSSRAESMKGTPNFLAPEVYNGNGGYTQSVDLYSLGMVLYRLLNYSRNPFVPQFPAQFYAEDESIAFDKRMKGEIPNLPSLGGKDIGNVIIKAISNCDERFQSADEFLQSLETAIKITPDSILDEKVEYIEFPEIHTSGKAYETTLNELENSSKKNSDSNKVHQNSINSHLFDTVMDDNQPNISDETNPVVAQNSNKSGLLKKMLIFLLPLMIVGLFAGGYFIILPKFNNSSSQTEPSNLPQNTTSNSDKETDSQIDKIEDLKNLAANAFRGNPKCKYLGKDIKAYSNGYYYNEHDESSPFSLGGVPYKSGFTIDTKKEQSYVNFNLEGKYKYLSGVAGYIDHKHGEFVTYNVIGDNEFIGNIKLKYGDLPKAFEFDVTGVKQLTIVVIETSSSSYTVGFGNVALYNDKSDKPESYEKIELPKVAYLGSTIKAYSNAYEYHEYNETETFNIGGQRFTNGFTIGTNPANGFVSFNIGGQYKSLSGLVGNVDKKNYSVTYNILGDGKSLGLVDVKGGDLPVPFKFDVTGIKQINIIATGTSNYGKAVGFANVELK